MILNQYNITLNNTCDNYVQREDHTGTGLKPCLNGAKTLLVYYNKNESMAKHMYLCLECFLNYVFKNNEHIHNVRSKTIDLEELK